MTSSVVDLRSDAVTLPSSDMRQAMAAAQVGDDDFGEDPTINLLEERCSTLLGRDAALFVNSGTMGNLLAVLAQVRPGQTVVAGLHSHIFDHEFHGIRLLARVGLRPVKETVVRGQLTWDLSVVQAMLSEPAQSRPALLCLEQTVNRLGGVVMPLAHMAELYALAHAQGINVHLDGARLINATVALGVAAADLAQFTDTVMTVFTKSLGAPGGAMLAGPRAVIDAARQRRHYVGGGMKQGGILAAACLVALEHTGAIAADHGRAKELARGLAALPKIEVKVENVVSNIVQVDVRPLNIDHETVLNNLKTRGVLALFTMPGILRLVVHRDIDDGGIQHTIAAFREVVTDCDEERS